MDCIYGNNDEYILNKKPKKLIVFDDMIPDILRNKRLNPRVIELVIRGRKLSIAFVFAKSYFAVSKILE